MEDAGNVVGSIGRSDVAPCDGRGRMRHLQTLRLIEDVARAGSIRKAAEDQNITSSALNRTGSPPFRTHACCTS